MTVTKEELAARDLIDNWIGQYNIQIDTDGLAYWALVEKIQTIVKELDLMKKHADEGWKLANQRTTERQELLRAMKSVRGTIDPLIEKFKPLLEV
jgi:hypothetical protein